MEEKKEKLPYEKAEMQIIEIQSDGFLTQSAVDPSTSTTGTNAWEQE